MINYISAKSASILLRHRLIENTELNIYVYGFSLFYSTLITASVILFISLLFYTLLHGIIFICFFAIPRFFLGGYHASSFGKCFLISNLVFLLLSISSFFANFRPFYVTILFFYLISLLFIYCIVQKTIAKDIYQKVLKLLIFEHIICISMILLTLSTYSLIAMEATITMFLFIIIGRRCTNE